MLNIIMFSLRSRHVKDLIILTSGVQILSLISNYFWLLWLLVSIINIMNESNIKSYIAINYRTFISYLYFLLISVYLVCCICYRYH